MCTSLPENFSISYLQYRDKITQKVAVCAFAMTRSSVEKRGCARFAVDDTTNVYNGERVAEGRNDEGMVRARETAAREGVSTEKEETAVDGGEHPGERGGRVW